MKHSLPLSILFFGLTMSFLFIGCDEDDNPVGPSGSLVKTMSYTVSDNKFILEYEEEIISWSYCDGDELITQSDTIEAGVDTMEFELSGDTIKIVHDRFILQSGSVVQYQTICIRKGSGDSLVGIWTISHYTYEVISGELTQDEINDINDDIDEYNEELMEYSIDIEITKDMVYIYERELVEWSYADMFIEEWNDYYGQYFDITIAKVNNRTVKLTGNTTGEVVTVTVNRNEDIIYTSSNSEHGKHVYYSNPTQCPNDYQPEWFDDFLSDNYASDFNKKSTFKFNEKLLNRKKQSFFIELITKQ